MPPGECAGELSVLDEEANLDRSANAQLRRRRKVGELHRQPSLADRLTGLQNRAWMHEQFGRGGVAA